MATYVYLLFRDRNGAEGMKDPEGIQASITHFIAQLHGNIQTSLEKELVTKRLLDLAKSRMNARAAIGSHSRAIPSLVALLKSGNGQGLPAQALQERAIVLRLGSESINPSLADIRVVDIVGTLAYALMVFNGNSDPAGSLDAVKIEGLLFRQLKPCTSQLVQERAIAALASLYGNAYLSRSLRHAKEKRMLVGLVTMATSEVQEDLMQLLISLCSANSDLWQSFRGPEGIQLLIPFLGLTSEQQERAVALLLLLSIEVDDSKRTIAEAGGILPLVQLLKNGSWKAKKDAALLLGNLCAQSEEIRSSVENVDAVPALLSLLGKDSLRRQGSAAKALKHLIRAADAATLNQLVDLLLENEPKSKVHVIMVLGSLLSFASHEDLVQQGSAANNGLQFLVRMLDSSVEEINRYFSAQGLARLVSNGSSGTVLAVANSGAAGCLVLLLGSGKPDISNLVELTEEFPSIPNPSHVVLECLFRVDDTRVGATARQSIPSLVDLLNPIPDKPGATPLALGLLTQIARGNNADKVAIVEAGALIALLKLLRSHQYREAVDAAGLLEALFNNMKVQEMEVFKSAISPLLQYLLDPHTRAQPVRLLAAHTLGDLFQHDGLARTTDALSACRALVSLLKDQPLEEITMAALRALQNLVRHSRTNRSAVAEEGGILVVQNLLSSNNPEMTGKAALLIKFMFSEYTLQEYISSDLLMALTDSLDREFLATATLNEEVVKAINILLNNSSKLMDTEATTYCIPHLIAALKSGTESAQEVALEALFLLKNSWVSIHVASDNVQPMVETKAIPILQLLISSGPRRFYQKAESLLQCLPGILTVTVKRGTNFKRSMRSTNALVNRPTRLTNVVYQSTSPEWKQEFAWAFDTPPIAQKLHISCMGKNTFGRVSLGEVTVQIDNAVIFRRITRQYTLIHDANNAGTSRTLEIEFHWSNR